MPEIKVPAAMTGGSASEVVVVEGSTVREALNDHAAEYGPELRDSVLEGDDVREYINVFVNGEEVDQLDGLETPLGRSDTIRIVPAASGG